MTDTLPKTSIFQYGILALPLAFVGMPLYIYAPDYYASQYGVSLSVLATVLLVLRFFDAVCDPLLGRMLDTYRPHTFKIVFFAMVGLVLGFYMVFNPLFEQAVLYNFTVAVVFATTGYSIISIALNSLGGLWKSDVKDKARISAYRESFGIVGVLCAVTIPVILGYGTIENPAPIFTIIAIMVAGISVVCLGLFYIWCKNNTSVLNRVFVPSVSSQPLATSNPHLKTGGVLSDRTIKIFFCIYGFGMIASSIPAVLVLFFIRDVLGLESMAGIFLALYFASGILGAMLWRWATTKISPYSVWMYSIVLAIFSFIWVLTLQSGDAVQYGIICIVSGIAFGGDLVLPPAILATHIQDSGKTKTSATYFGILTFLSKTGLAISSFVVLPILDLTGFIPAGQNSPQALQTVTLLYAGVPCILKCISIGIFWRYKNQIGNRQHSTGELEK